MFYLWWKRTSEVQIDMCCSGVNQSVGKYDKFVTAPKNNLWDYRYARRHILNRIIKVTLPDAALFNSDKWCEICIDTAINTGMGQAPCHICIALQGCGINQFITIYF